MEKYHIGLTVCFSFVLMCLCCYLVFQVVQDKRKYIYHYCIIHTISPSNREVHAGTMTFGKRINSYTDTEDFIKKIFPDADEAYLLVNIYLLDTYVGKEKP
jgi:hypothetical protein